MSLRTEIENEIYSLYDDVDTSGRNTDRIRAFFKTKTDKEFYEYMDNFFDTYDLNFNISFIPQDNNINMDRIHEIADNHGIEIYEYIFRPDLSGDPNDPIGSVEKIATMDIPVKRLQQTLLTKNHTTTSISKRNQEVGQATGDDKIARMTDTEGYSMIVQNQYNSAREMYTFRADDMSMKADAMKQIAETGELVLDEIKNDTLNKTTMNTINYYMLGSCLKTNFIDKNGYLLPSTIMSREEKNTTIRR